MLLHSASFNIASRNNQTHHHLLPKKTHLITPSTSHSSEIWGIKLVWKAYAVKEENKPAQAEMTTIQGGKEK